MDRSHTAHSEGPSAFAKPGEQHSAAAELELRHVSKRYDGQRTVRFVSEILEVMPPGDTERPAVNRLFLPEGPSGRAIAAHTPSPPMLARLEAAGFSPHLLDRPGLPGADRQSANWARR